MEIRMTFRSLVFAAFVSANATSQIISTTAVIDIDDQVRAVSTAEIRVLQNIHKCSVLDKDLNSKLPSYIEERINKSATILLEKHDLNISRTVLIQHLKQQSAKLEKAYRDNFNKTTKHLTSEEQQLAIKTAWSSSRCDRIVIAANLS